MIAPEQTSNSFRYALYTEAESSQKLEHDLEKELCRNYHYRHARNLRQLEHAAIYTVENGEQKYIAHLIDQGFSQGGIKLPALRTETFWTMIFADQAGSMQENVSC